MQSIEEIRAQLTGKHMNRPDCLVVLDTMIVQAAMDPEYAANFARWLDPEDEEASTVHLRDVLCEPLRNDKHVAAVGEKFNPTTKWDNTWIPLDTALHRSRHNIHPDEL